MTGVTTARAEGLVACRRCARVWPAATPRCTRCGARLTSRDRHSLHKVWFWWALGVAAYIPAMLLPMLETRILLSRSEDTIVAGAVKLAQHGSVGIAAVILLASVAVPIAKLGVIAWLARAVGRGAPRNAHRLTRAFEAVEFIGRWSMVDVFVVAILASLVQVRFVASVTPGPAAVAFALSVIFTMLAALSFDSRLIWDLEDEAGVSR